MKFERPSLHDFRCGFHSIHLYQDIVSESTAKLTFKVTQLNCFKRYQRPQSCSERLQCLQSGGIGRPIYTNNIIQAHYNDVLPSRAHRLHNSGSSAVFFLLFDLSFLNSIEQVCRNRSCADWPHFLLLYRYKSLWN